LSISAPSSSAPPLEATWAGEDVTIAQIERELARLRDETSQQGSQPNLRTSVMTHIAWAPPKWQVAAEETLAGMAERHPSRTVLMIPRPDAKDDRIDAQLSLRCFPIGDRAICGEVIELELCGERAVAPASIAEPLLITDLPVFCRWRGEPPFGSEELWQMVDMVDRLIVDSDEWEEPRCAELVELFARVAVSDIAWRRIESWRFELAKHWPEIRKQKIEVGGPRAEATLLRAWLSSLLKRKLEEIELTDAKELTVQLDGEQIPTPRPLYETPSDLLSAELDQFTHDPIYEEAVRTVAGV
jgi:glucose-6-phosphate dehydrogenase assembly protein OpcA